LINVNKLKPYKYANHTLKASQSSNNNKSLKFIYSDHKIDQFDEDLEDERTSKIIDID
jgi:hypothetical protein